MDNLTRAKEKLTGDVTCVLVKGATEYISTDKGIKPMLEVLDSGLNVRGFAAADIIVGRAAALLFAVAGVKQVYGRVTARSALDVFDRYGISVEYGRLVDVIVNRAGTGPCPMEQTVAGVDDPTEAVRKLKEKFLSLGGVL